MKTLLLSSFLCIVSFAAISQATLTSSYNPVVGTTTSTIICDPAGIDPGPAGASQTWMFNLTPTNPPETLTYLDPSATPAAASFPTATIAYQENPSINLFGYYETSGSAMTYLGSGSDIEFISYSNPITNLVYPFAFGDSIVDTYGFDNGTSQLSGIQHVYYDGYGTLIINGTTYNNVLRIHNVKDDTTTFGAAVIPFHGEFYQWIDPTMPGQVLLHITLSSGFAFVRAIDAAVGINETSNALAFNLFPSITDEHGFTLSYKMETAQALQLTMYDALGRTMISKSLDAQQAGEAYIETNTLPKGLYTVQLKNENGFHQGGEVVGTRRVLIQ